MAQVRTSVWVGLGSGLRLLRIKIVSQISPRDKAATVGAPRCFSRSDAVTGISRGRE
jgi:hypothetical protein